MEKIRLAIIDDEKLIREGLRIILTTYEDIEVVAEGENGLEALKICDSHDIDLVLMDIRMPMSDGVQGTQLIKEKHSKTKVLILTTFKDTEYIQDALKMGASGYLLKDSSPQLIYEGIKAAVSGNIVMHPKVAHNILNYSLQGGNAADFCTEHGLTAKECTLIKLIATGLSNREIAEKLYLSEGTIKNYVSTILTKLNLRDRTQLVVLAYKSGIVR
ncbi:MAG TPA: response regulator transcription factor [Natronincola sp.]|nr:response regulator transcription factor [Natronincola sp.]